MLFATAGQGALAAWMLASGVAMGLVCLLFAGLRRLIQAGFVLTLCCDLACGALCALVFLFFLVRGNYGRLRLFEALAAALGMLICFGALKGVLTRLGGWCSRLGSGIKAWISENRLIKVIFR